MSYPLIAFLLFFKAGFDLEIFSQHKPKESLKHWKAIYAAHGEAGLLEERRGKSGFGRPSSKELSVEEKLRRAEAKIKLLEVENELKKAEGTRKAGEARQTLSISLRFELINRTIRQYGIKGLTRHLCKFAEVSVSGYYDGSLRKKPVNVERPTRGICSSLRHTLIV